MSIFPDPRHRLENPPEDDRAWRAQAACLGSDPAIFFTDRGESTREAKAICRTCPVIEPCLEHALTRREVYGIWGGKSERERRRIRRQRAREAKARAA